MPASMMSQAGSFVNFGYTDIGLWTLDIRLARGTLDIGLLNRCLLPLLIHRYVCKFRFSDAYFFC